MLAILALLIAPSVPGTALTGPGDAPMRPRAARDYDAVVERFQAAVARGEVREWRPALDALVELFDPRAVDVLLEHFTSDSAELRRARSEARKLRADLAHSRTVLANLERRVERDASLKVAIARQGLRVDGIEARLLEHTAAVARGEARTEALGEGIARLLAGLGRTKRGYALNAVWRRVKKPEDPASRAAAMELLGLAGNVQTAVELQRILGQVAEERAALLSRLPKLERKARELEQRIQKELAKVPPNERRKARRQPSEQLRELMAEYERQKSTAREARRGLADAVVHSGVCIEAAARALARGEGGELQKAVAALSRAFQRAPEGTRLATLEIFARVPVEPVAAELRALLAREKDPASVAGLIASLAAIDDRTAVPALVTYLEHESWHVQSAAAAGLAKLRSKAAIPVLIDRMDGVEGRVKTDVRRALVSLTGQDFHTNVPLWRRFWEERGATFEVAPEAAAAGRAADDEAGGVTFFGIHTDSQRVLFVLDLSGSMDFSMVTRENPDDSRGVPYDTPRLGEISRLTAAKQNLKRAMSRLLDGARFNLVLYANAVWTWQDGLVTMSPETRREAAEYVDTLASRGNTNLFGGLETALDLAGAREGDEWEDPAIDTIFLLSDGRPNGGRIDDPDEILAEVRERNRSAGIVIHTIGLSGAQDAYLLGSLAEQNGGVYVAH